MKFVRVQRAASVTLMVQVGAASVRVERGFDGELLREVVAALGVKA